MTPLGQHWRLGLQPSSNWTRPTSDARTSLSEILVWPANHKKNLGSMNEKQLPTASDAGNRPRFTKWHLWETKSTSGDEEADASNRYTRDGSYARAGTLCVFCSINKNCFPLCPSLLWEHANELSINHGLWDLKGNIKICATWASTREGRVGEEQVSSHLSEVMKMLCYALPATITITCFMYDCIDPLRRPWEGIACFLLLYSEFNYPFIWNAYGGIWMGTAKFLGF